MEYLAYFLGLYFATSVFLDFFTLGAIAFSGVQYGANSEAFLNAVRQVGQLLPSFSSFGTTAQLKHMLKEKVHLPADQTGITVSQLDSCAL